MATPTHGYRVLRVWQLSMDLVARTYQITTSFPRHETYGLTSQMRRAAVSIAANIAEGHGRRHLGDYLRHLSVANGSLREFETHILIAGRMSYLTDKDRDAALHHASDVARMLSGPGVLTQATRWLFRCAESLTPVFPPHSLRSATTASIRAVA